MLPHCVNNINTTLCYFPLGLISETAQSLGYLLFFIHLHVGVNCEWKNSLTFAYRHNRWNLVLKLISSKVQWISAYVTEFFFPNWLACDYLCPHVSFIYDDSKPERSDNRFKMKYLAHLLKTSVLHNSGVLIYFFRVFWFTFFGYFDKEISGILTKRILVRLQKIYDSCFFPTLH